MWREAVTLSGWLKDSDHLCASMTPEELYRLRQESIYDYMALNNEMRAATALPAGIARRRRKLRGALWGLGCLLLIGALCAVIVLLAWLCLSAGGAQPIENFLGEGLPK